MPTRTAPGLRGRARSRGTGTPAERRRAAASGPIPERYRLHAEICKVLTDPKRLMLLDALRRGPLTVGGLAAGVGVTLANASQHLAVLRHAGLVETQRSGTAIHYRLIEPDLLAACDLIERIVTRRLGPRRSPKA